MSGWVLPSYALFITLAFGVRSVVHLRLTGALPWVRPSSATQWVSEGLLAAGGAATFIACILSVAGVIPSIEGLDSAPGRALGAGLIVGAIALSVTTQAQMGRSWRAGVDPAARTELVTHGVFGSVRNPFYVSMILAAAGVALMIPSALSVAAVMVTVAGAEAVVVSRRSRTFSAFTALPMLPTGRGPAASFRGWDGIVSTEGGGDDDREVPNESVVIPIAAVRPTSARGAASREMPMIPIRTPAAVGPREPHSR